MDGYSLAARYSFITNKLKYCGPNETHLKFFDYIKTKDESLRGEIKKGITRFEGLYSYLEHISRKAGLELLDYRVLESYWIGNELLEEFDENDLKKIIMSLARRGLPLSYARKLCKNIPKGMTPHHSFNVIYVGVGKVTGSVLFNLENINNCLIRPGKVVNVMKDKVLLRHRSYIYETKKLILGNEIEEELDYFPEFFDDLKAGDHVSMHWKFVVDRLDAMQLRNLDKYNERNVSALNKFLV